MRGMGGGRREGGAGGNSGVAEKGIPDTMMAGGNLSPSSKVLRCSLRFLSLHVPFPPRDLAYEEI